MINDNYINIAYKEKIIISKKFDENDKKIKVIDEKVSVNNTLIVNNFTSILLLKTNYVIDNIWLFNLYKRDINFTYENDIIYDFKVGSIIELDESCLYIYDSLKNYLFYIKRNLPISRSKQCFHR